MSTKSLDTVVCLLAQHARGLAPEMSERYVVVHAPNVSALLALEKVDVILADPSIGDAWTMQQAEQIVEAFGQHAEIIFLAAPPIDLRQLDRRFSAMGIMTLDSTRVTSGDIRSIINGMLTSKRMGSRSAGPGG